MPSRKSLLCAAMPFGYGPAAKLLALAPRLREDWRLVFAGRGTAAELVGRHRERFDQVVEGPFSPAAMESLVAEADGVLSIMDREWAVWAQRLGKPLYVVDSLLWMRSEIPPELRHASIYWAQRFGDDDGHSISLGAEIVGPILAAGESTARPAGLVINLGGCATPEEPSPVMSHYLEFIAEGLLASGICSRFPAATLLVGQDHVAKLQERLAGSPAPVRVRSISHDEATSQMQQASVVFTAPGLTATLEAFQAGRPTFFLPPQNYSQWCILNRLRRLQLAPCAFPWEEAAGQPRLVERMSESERTPLVRQAICDSTQDSAARETFRRRLAEIPSLDGPALAARQVSFLISLGPCGLSQITARLARVARGEGFRDSHRPSTMGSLSATARGEQSGLTLRD